ncbi:MAG: hypothetical protein P0Y65_14200 [Candidatus Devosia phytovorans]|uniref:Uncharacterized protein n=1 Tax=Candidatus Devosia phytovorans TaxID=3121372 RepID=A0AAJ6AZQ3_9HYPH|nr:hypothetical protein [Devosia sp.]WEK03339.1 MAG: hypothetical protein P0Y65_14200 [Devosia sp.]
MSPRRFKPRSVHQVEIYLDRLALAARRADDKELRRLLPIFTRLNSELVAAAAEEELVEAILKRPLRPERTVPE